MSIVQISIFISLPTPSVIATPKKWFTVTSSPKICSWVFMASLRSPTLAGRFMRPPHAAQPSVVRSTTCRQRWSKTSPTMKRSTYGRWGFYAMNSLSASHPSRHPHTTPRIKKFSNVNTDFRLIYYQKLVISFLR